MNKLANEKIHSAARNALDDRYKILVCSNCRKRSESLKENPEAWNGWTFYTNVYGHSDTLCPECREKLEEK